MIKCSQCNKEIKESELLIQMETRINFNRVKDNDFVPYGEYGCVSKDSFCSNCFNEYIKTILKGAKNDTNIISNIQS